MSTCLTRKSTQDVMTYCFGYEAPPLWNMEIKADFPTVASPTTTTLHLNIKIVRCVVSMDRKQLSMGSGTSHFCSAGASSPFSSPTAAMLVCVGLPVDGARRAAGGVLIGTGGRAFAAAGRGSSLAPSVPLFYWAPVWLSMRMPQPEITTTDGWPTPGGLGHRLDRRMGANCCLLVSYRPLAGISNSPFQAAKHGAASCIY